MVNYRIDPRQDIEGQFTAAIQDIVLRNSLARVREKVGKAVDKELGQTFRYIRARILAQRAAPGQAISPFKPYLPEPWAPYDPVYEQRKHRKVRHRRWFKYGAATGNREGEATLEEEFGGITPNEVLREVGNTQVVIRRNRTGLTIKMLPKVKFALKDFEQNFAGSLSEIAMKKLENRQRRYRALVGPAFAYEMAERVPEVVRQALRNL